jgi:hypothetical protein
MEVTAAALNDVPIPDDKGRRLQRQPTRGERRPALRLRRRRHSDRARASRGGGVAPDHDKIGARGGVGSFAPLLPIPQRSTRNMKPRREFFLRQAQRAPNNADLRVRFMRAKSAGVSGFASGSGDYGDSLLNLRLQDRREAYRRSFPVSLPFTGRNPCSQRARPQSRKFRD